MGTMNDIAIELSEAATKLGEAVQGLSYAALDAIEAEKVKESGLSEKLKLLCAMGCIAVKKIDELTRLEIFDDYRREILEVGYPPEGVEDIHARFKGEASGSETAAKKEGRGE